MLCFASCPQGACVYFFSPNYYTSTNILLSAVFHPPSLWRCFAWAFLSMKRVKGPVQSTVELQSAHVHTGKTKCRKFETNIPRKGISGPQSQFPHILCLWASYIFPRWVCLFCWRKYVDRSWEYVNRSQTHECGNWDWGRAIPRKGIYKRNCRCSACKDLSWMSHCHVPSVYRSSASSQRVFLFGLVWVLVSCVASLPQKQALCFANLPCIITPFFTFQVSEKLTD